MDADARRLWSRIEGWALSPPEHALEFEGRLADACGWTLGHAMAVTREYRRFLMLTQMQSGGAPPRPVEPVAPSDDVDAAWHLHITRTSDYERCCFEVFGRFLHHHPSRGGVEELARHRQMYARTLDVYRDVFDETPPPAVWPGVDERFGAPPRRAVAEPAVRADMLARALLLAAGLAVAGALAMACAATGVLAPLRAIPGPSFALGYLVLLALLALAGFLPAGRGRRLQACDVVETYELAFLVGGVRRMAATAVVSLVDAGRARLVAATAPARRPGQRRAPARTQVLADAAFAADTPPSHPAERSILEAATARAIDFGAACRAVAPAAAVTQRRLLAAGLVRDRGLLESRRLTVFAAALLLLAIVLERMAHAIDVQRRVGFLVALLALHLVLCGGLVLQRGRLTPRGRAVVKHMKGLVPRPRPRRAGAAAAAAAGGADEAVVVRADGVGAALAPDQPAPADGMALRSLTQVASPSTVSPRRTARAEEAWLALPTIVALFGAPAVMADPRFAGIEHAIGREGLASSGGDAGGSGCSGGGGGCGGCGGS